ncbi:hypothetical protein L1987_29387 [Smallanthus sonchifolius]|uniref:Uncharacterized protein n=1 Tax=Smallanthus sonchifolius TaxID=185202 RepID=A0ACB9I0N8_9ASTR|nr:hypothetical protein L1987_29387 [Smallanthus sonchifolius]
MPMQPTTENKSVPAKKLLVFVPSHPLIKHWVSVLRNEQTPPPIFRNAMAELGRLLMYEASRDWLPTVSGEIQSPLGVASVEFIDPREAVVVVPILRAGLALAEHASSILPATKTYHLGVSRNEETLQPTIYLNKLPAKFSEGTRVFIVDPMLATGKVRVLLDMCCDVPSGTPKAERQETAALVHKTRPEQVFCRTCFNLQFEVVLKQVLAE